jgi:hypothetical protein
LTSEDIRSTTNGICCIGTLDKGKVLQDELTRNKGKWIGFTTQKALITKIMSSWCPFSCKVHIIRR